MPELAKSLRINSKSTNGSWRKLLSQKKRAVELGGEEPVRQLQMPREHFDNFNKVWATAANT